MADESPATVTPGAIIATWIGFFIVSLAAGRMGILFPRYLSLPLITGYLVVGSIAGPFVLDIIHKEDLPRLSYVTQFALAFIAFSAGSELYLPELRSLFKRIMYQTSSIALVTFVTCTALIFSLGQLDGLVPFMSGLPMACQASVATIAAAIMVARSPASAIAVVKELKAKGTFTSTLLGVTVACDVYVLLAFTVTTSIAESTCRAEQMDAGVIGMTLACIVASLIIGYFVGKFLLVLMWFKRIPTKYLILPLGLAIFVATHALTEYSHDAPEIPYVINLEPLLICITGGFVCSNQSRHRGRFISVLQQAGPYVFLPFFTLTGASLDLRVMLAAFGFAAIVATVRAVSIFVGSSTGGWLAGQDKKANMLIWMTLLTQAGVSLGLASEVGMTFPGWGRAFQTSIIAVVVINQILGPILFKIAVRRMGEAGKGGGGDEHDEDRVIPTALVVGSSPDAIATAIRLLRAKWAVKLLAPTDKEAAAARAEIARYVAEAEAVQAREKGALVHAVTSAGSAAVAELKDGLKVLKAKVDGSDAQQAQAGEGAPAGGAAATPAAAAAPAPAVDEHGHHIRHLDDLLECVGLLPDTTAPGENPFVHDSAALASLSVAATVAPVAGADGAAAPIAGAGIDFRFARLVAEISTGTRTLQAVAIALPSDATCFAAARVLHDTVCAAPKRSHLHSVRISAVVRSPVWSSAYSVLGGIIPLHAASAATHMAAVLLTAPLVRPVTAFAPATSKDDLAQAAGHVLLEGPHFWRFASAGADASAGASLPQAVNALLASRASAVSSAPGLAGGAAGGSATLRSLVTLGTNDAEMVPEWQRDEYINALDSLSDNSAVKEEVMRGTTRKADLDDMYGSISSYDTGSGESEEVEGGKGLAAQDGKP